MSTEPGSCFTPDKTSSNEYRGMPAIPKCPLHGKEGKAHSSWDKIIIIYIVHEPDAT